MARRIGWEEARNCLRRYREDQIRDGEAVVRLWDEVLMKERNKLGDELWVVYEQVCIAALDCRRHDLAEACIEVLKDNFPKSVRVERLKGMWLESAERFSSAEEVYAKIIEKDETNMGFTSNQQLRSFTDEKFSSAFARKRQVAVLKAQNKIPEAIEKLNKYLQNFMTDFEAWMELCDLYLTQQDYTKAAFCLEELLMSNPHNHLYHQKYAEIRYSQGDFEISKSYYAQALKLNPNNVRALYGFFLTCCNLTSTTKGKEKQNHIKYAGWAAQQLKERYMTVQPEEVHTQTRVMETLERLLESITEKPGAN